MLLSRILLFVQGIMGVVYGVMILVDPSEMAANMGFTVLTGDGQAEVITNYFGLSAAVGMVMLYSSITKSHLEIATLFAAIFISGIAIGRVIGFIFYDTSFYTASALGYDVPMSLLCWFAVFRNSRAESAAA